MKSFKYIKIYYTYLNTALIQKEEFKKTMSNISLEQKYQKKSDKQHVLDNPDTYTGSMESTEYYTYIYDEDSKMIKSKMLEIIPGLYKLFDEGIVNCRDHYVRMEQAVNNNIVNAIPVTKIEISISKDGTITMLNDGNGIDIEKHPEHDIWIPEMIFGHLRTSTNYDKNEKKIVGGKNGFGFKLVLIWSTWGRIETVDHTRGLKYIQEFKDNLNIIEKPKITKVKGKPYTCVTFKPDYKRLGLEGLSDDMLSLFKRRVYDIAAVTNKNIKVKYNDEVVPVKNFQQYVDQYIGTKTETKRCYEEANDRWEYAVSLAPNEEFTQVSFVNGIYTSKGGTHVQYILNQIIRKLTAYILKKKKINVKQSTIKEQIMLFVRCDIENPTFDSQTKDYMTTPISKFGSNCDVSEKFIEKIAKMGIMDAACALTEIKETKEVKKADGVKSKTIRGIPKLIDANYAGTDKSHECTIIFCEGDSAKAGIVSGLSKEDRNYIGVYPMRGKLFNVRGETKKRISENKEIHEIKQILGLELNKKYTEENVKKCLRYGKVLFMTDQDLDGTHIKGLGINLFDSEWGSLIQIPGFIGFMNTPILKAKKGNNELCFYNDGEYEEWKKSNNTNGWKIKYYKGLGTSTGKEFKEYFEKKKVVTFTENGELSKDSIDMVFNKKRAPDRKAWLEKYDRNLFLDTNKPEVSYEEFIEREMIHFSKYDCERSIPNLMDGLKTSQRKILYAAFKRKLNAEIKVSQFSGYVSEHSSYHHGEQSLNAAIVNMAQDYVGSNNINLLEPRGQFGTRLKNGQDSASERYIFTLLNPITRQIFQESDDNILTYLDDDGVQVEPMFYAPILPMILVNGSKGIGTGFSTDIPCYNPLDIIEYMKKSINNEDTTTIQFIPYYKDFKGKIIPVKNTDNTKFLVKGVYEVVNSKTVRITELPIGTATEDYKVFLEELIEPPSKSSSSDGKKKQKKEIPIVKNYTDMSTDKIVDFYITFANGMIEQLENKTEEENINGLEKYLRLVTTKTTTNMHMFDETEKLKKFKDPKDIIEHFMKVRFTLYIERKKYQLSILEKECNVLNNKARFINENLSGDIDLRRKKKIEVREILEKRGYDKIEDDEDYKYLVKMPMDMVTEENVEKLNKERDIKLQEFNVLQNTKEIQIWMNELDNIKENYERLFSIKNNDNNKMNENKIKQIKKSNKVIKVVKVKK